MARRHLLGALVGELGRRSEAARMIDQRVAEADPQLRVAGIALYRILQDATASSLLPSRSSASDMRSQLSAGVK